MFDYYIVGDFNICGKVKSCLIFVAGRTEEQAEAGLKRVLANPPKDCLGNIHIKKEETAKCWWNDKVD